MQSCYKTNNDLNIEREKLQMGRSILIPYKYRASLISTNTSDTVKKRVELESEFSSLNSNSSIFQNSNLDYNRMLDFF